MYQVKIARLKKGDIVMGKAKNVSKAANATEGNAVNNDRKLPFFKKENAYPVFIAQKKAIFVDKESGEILGPIGEGTLGIILYGGDPTNDYDRGTGRLNAECAVRIPRLLQSNSFLNFNIAEISNYEGKQAIKFSGKELLLGADSFFRLNEPNVFTKIPTTEDGICYIGFYLATDSKYKICLVSKDDCWPEEFKKNVRDRNLFEEIKKYCDCETEQFDNLLFFPEEITNRRKNDDRLQVFSRERIHTIFRQKNINGWWFNLPIAIYPWMSCDLERVLTAYVDYGFTLKVWDLDSYRELAALSSHSNSVESIAITPDGKRAVSASRDKTIKVWDLDSYRELAVFSGHSNSVESIAITPDGKRAVSASRDKTLRIWDLDSYRELAVLSGHSEWVNGVAITPDGKRAVSASRDKTLKIWDLDSGQELAVLSGHSEWVNGVAITPDGKRAVSASGDKTLKVWDLDSYRELAILSGHSDWVNGVAITPDGKRAVSASWDKTLKVWDLDSYRELAVFSGHSNSVESVAITPDGKQVVSASRDKTVKVWDLESGRELAVFSGHSEGIYSVTITPDGKRAVAASYDIETHKNGAEDLSDRKIVEDLRNWELSEWFKLFSNLCNGILNLHGQGCIHGDSRPANIMTKLSINTKLLANSFRWIDIALGYDTGSSMAPISTLDNIDNKNTTIVPRPLGGGRTTPFYAPERTEGLEYEDADSIRLEIIDSEKFRLIFLYKHNTFAEPRILQLKRDGIALCELGTLNKSDRIQVKEYVFVVEAVGDTEIIVSHIFELALDRLLIDISSDKDSRESIVNILNGTAIPRYRVFRQWSEATDIYGLGVTIFYILYMKGLSRIKQDHPNNRFTHREEIFNELIDLLRNKSFLNNTLHIITSNGYGDFESLCTQAVLSAKYTKSREPSNTIKNDSQKISAITDTILNIDSNFVIVLYGLNHCRGLFVQILYFVFRCLWRMEDLNDEQKLFEESYKFIPFCANKIRIEDNNKKNEPASAAYKAMDRIQSEISRVALSSLNNENSELEQQKSDLLLTGRIDQVIDLNQKITVLNQENNDLKQEINVCKDKLTNIQKDISDILRTK
jgi:WD40 repeat protein